MGETDLQTFVMDYSCDLVLVFAAATAGQRAKLPAQVVFVNPLRALKPRSSNYFQATFTDVDGFWLAFMK